MGFERKGNGDRGRAESFSLGRRETTGDGVAAAQGLAAAAPLGEEQDSFFF